METAAPDEWYAEACRRARAHRRRRSAERASTEWPEFAPPVARADGVLGEIQDCDREIARLTAVRARKVAEFAATRPASADRAQGEPGAMSPDRWAARAEILRDVSEWAGQELVVALSLSQQAADGLLERSLTLVHRLPGTHAALQAGALHPGHLWALLDKVAPIEDDTIRAEVEAELLRWMHGRVTSPGQLADKARRVVLQRDARAAARNLEKAIRDRGVHLAAGRTDGMAAVTLLLTTPEARAFVQALGQCADALDDDPDAPPRTRSQKMADCAMDLVLRPGETNLPLVQILLHVVASVGTLAGGDQPGEIDGTVVPAEMIRELVRALGPRGAAPSGPAPAGDESDGAESDGDESDGEESDGANTAQGSGPAWEQFEGELLAAWEAEVLTRQLAHPAARDPDFLTYDPLDRPPQPHGEPTPPRPDTGGWWATADRAVDDAGVAVLRAHEALTRAGQLVRAARAADAGDESEWRDGPGGRVTAAEDAVTALRVTTDERRAWLADLLAATGGGGLVERPRILLTDALTGALVALTDLPAMRRAAANGAALGPPGPTGGYRPSAPLDRWVRARDRRCRFPGCRRRVPRGGELDHDRRYPDGPTSARNLAGYCTGHHRGKHQAPGWRHALAPDGALTVTTPTGLTAVTTPPPY
ncbi:HNH endonuclease signature motif containing protein [Blastococcus sp. PRF04-17]|uniref:HNH endonuclease signature motif containing protein n=1 Tax=Blastococcus sp. PRF04-17 TaxID=2933797 RepID=UPI001FF697D4|nr:HNH endonuclease signature motif containing protein [Blastococcus sp. PRF04-17]UOY02099.1 HNH endonuclease [Blastococcus sp. PRF04-17]